MLYIACIEQENIVDNDFNEDVRTFLMSDFWSTFDKYFSGVLTILINKKFYRRMSCYVELLLFLHFLLPKLTIIFLIWS